MPWVLKNTAYIETDIRYFEEFHVHFRLKQVVEKYKAAWQSGMPEMQPPVEEVMPLIEEFGKIWYVKTQFGQGGEAGKRKLELLRQLNPIMLQWGEYIAAMIDGGKIQPWDCGFPCLMMYSLRRPAYSTSYRVHKDIGKGTYTMECGKHPALLLFFHWQASEDGQNWFTLATTRQPKLTTKKLDPHKRYAFRMYMTNPKGNSDMHLYNHGWMI